MPSKPARDAASPTRFFDFSIRAWLEGHTVAVIAHASPVGGMREPVSVRIGRFNADDWRLRHDADWQEAATLGRELARWILPPEVWSRLGDSVRALSAIPNAGIRIRLCLSEDLIDLPWEYLYRPDVTDAAAPHSGFLLMDGRLSLVREPATLLVADTQVTRAQRGLFVGALWNDGSDGWGVKAEYNSLKRTLSPLRDLVQVRAVWGGDPDRVEAALDDGCDFFHYSGHTNLDTSSAGEPTLVRVADARFLAASGKAQREEDFDAVRDPASWNRVSTLAARLRQGGARCVLLNACNSGFWSVAEPFLKAGAACLVGVQGLVSNLASLHFAEKLYCALAVGLSVDEAVTWARLHVMESGRAYWPTDWGRFMVYMPAASSVLFPRATDRATTARRTRALAARAVTVRKTQSGAAKHDAEGFQRQFTDMSEVSVLILGRFTPERKPILDDLRRLLAKQRPRPYVPILFDFEKAKDRDLIESALRFAAVSRFVIADLSDPKSVPAELMAIVPAFPSLPIIALIEEGQREYPVSDNILRRESVLKPLVRYRDRAHLEKLFTTDIIQPAERLVRQLRPPVLT